MISNFSFVKERNLKLYKELLHFEKNIKLNTFGIGNAMRQILEDLCRDMIENYGILPEIEKACAPKTPDLNAMMKLLSDNKNFIPAMRLLPGCEGIRALPDFRVKLEYITYGNVKLSRCIDPTSMTEADYSHYSKVNVFLRTICNQFSHSENSNYRKVFKRNYDNASYALKILHRYIREYYGLTNKEVPDYSENKAPIGNYEIIKAYVPQDRKRTGCIKEYVANRYEPFRDKSVGTSVIRQYLKDESQTERLRRVADVYLLKEYSGSLLKKISLLPEENSEDSPFYFVTYDFGTEAHGLNTKFLGTLSFKERAELCLSYANTLKNFHNNTTPIYHRLLNSHCAYYSDRREAGKGITTAIIKFGYAKIDDFEYETVLGKEAPHFEAAHDETRYMAPEWKSLSNPESKEWGKADIYSLKTLFTDILMGQIGGYNECDFAVKPEMEKFLPLIEQMDGIAECRPDINEVCDYLEEILR